MKRRLSANDGSSVSLSTGRPKRLRYDSLERTLAHMTLGSALVTTSEDVDMLLKTPPPPHCVQDNLPSSVEEPGTPVSEPVEMDVEPTLHWESVDSGRVDIKEVQISPAVLECLQRQTKCPPPLVPLPSQTCQALVLYRAPRPPPPHEDERTGTSSLVTDDVMDVE